MWWIGQQVTRPLVPDGRGDNCLQNNGDTSGCLDFVQVQLRWSVNMSLITYFFREGGGGGGGHGGVQCIHTGTQTATYTHAKQL